MPNERPTDFSTLTGTNLADDDWFVGVDKSDTTDNASGSDIKISAVEMANGLSRRFRMAVISDPSTPASGLMQLFARITAGYHSLRFVDPLGRKISLQPSLQGNSIFYVTVASGTTAPTCVGGTLTTAATMSMVQTIASSSPWQATQRKRFTTAATAASASGMRTAYSQWFRSNALGYGGFFFRGRVGQNINLNGAQIFFGLAASTAALATTAGAAAALLNMCGIGYDTTDASTGNWYFYRNDGSGTATKVDLGATEAARNTTHGYDLIMYMAPNSSELFVRVVNLHTGNTVLDTSYTTDLPVANTGLCFHADVNNGAVAAACNLEVSVVYIETDY